MRVALNVEQLLQRPPGGIGRYTAELARLLPTSAPPADVDVTLFAARHSRGDVERRASRAFGLTSDAVVLPLPRPVLYDAWTRARASLVPRKSRALRDVDLVHAPSLAVPPRDGVPLVVTVHDAAPILFPEHLLAAAVAASTARASRPTAQRAPTR